MKKIVRSFITGPLATFHLTGDSVKAEYHDGDFQNEMENNGIFAHGKTLRPRDGRVFFDGLEEAYAQSSFVSVSSE